MGREIRFRLLSATDKIVGYEKWYVGSMDSQNFYIAEPCWLYSEDGEKWNPKKIDHRKKDQSTGLRDKAGVEIFEGDLVRVCSQYETEEPVDSSPNRVYFKDGAFRCGFHDMILGEKVCTGSSGNWNMEVIGKIHQHPELLDGGGK